MRILIKRLARLPWRVIVLFRRSLRKCGMVLVRPLFASIGARVYLAPLGDYSFSKIHLGSDVFIGCGIVMLSGSRGSIEIGSHVMIGPNVSFYSGNHSTSYTGRFMSEVGEEEKFPEDERGIVVEDDVWIGARAIILDGANV